MTAISRLSSSGTADRMYTVSNIQNAVIQPYENTPENAYMQPSIRDPKPIVWIAQDKLGIAEDEVRRIRASGLNILVSTKGARFNEKINIEINGSPPDHIGIAENENVRTCL